MEHPGCEFVTHVLIWLKFERMNFSCICICVFFQDGVVGVTHARTQDNC